MAAVKKIQAPRECVALPIGASYTPNPHIPFKGLFVSALLAVKCSEHNISIRTQILRVG